MWSFFEFLDDQDCVLTILDIGAAMTTVPSYQALLDAKRARLIGFEPDQRECKRLIDHYGSPHCFYPHFLGDGKPAIFHETNFGTTGSLYEPNVPLLDKFHLMGELTVPINRHTVETVRLDDIKEIEDVDFIKIDCQGSELTIFQNATRALRHACVIQTEVGFVELYKGQPFFADVDKHLRNSGFQFHDLLGFGERPFKPLLNPRHASVTPLLRTFRQRLWADVYYVKDWMKLDCLAPPKLKRMAALLHDVVESYDLAFLVLQELDRQTGGDLSSEYFRRLQLSGRAAWGGGVQPLNSLDLSAVSAEEEKRVLNVGGYSKDIPLPTVYEGWKQVLLDIDPNCCPDIQCDARELNRLPASVFDSVYCSHNLEHYFQHDVPKVLAGFRHVLKDNGFLYVRVPDIGAVLRAMHDRGLELDEELYESPMGPITVRDVVYGLGREIERSGSDFFAHKTGFSETTLVKAIASAGFPHVFTQSDSLEIRGMAFLMPPAPDIAEQLGFSEMRNQGNARPFAVSSSGSSSDVSADAENKPAAHKESSIAKPRSIMVRTCDGLLFSVPDTLKCISTYVLLEQEKWLEREVGFLTRWFQPGMNAIDIGANVGVYCLPLGKATGVTGSVFAFEPGRDARIHLESACKMNQLDNVHLVTCALSDSEKVGSMKAGRSGELSTLSVAGEGAGSVEAVRVSTLDIQARELNWPSIDFVKIDAEGHEARIIAGGQSFFKHQSPLVMYEIKSGGVSRQSIRWTFEALGYRTYRLLGDGSFLVSVESDEAADRFELNFFAARHDRATTLARHGLLALDQADNSEMPKERFGFIHGLLDLPYARAFEFSIDDVLRCPYGDALDFYSIYRSDALDPSLRYSALRRAFSILEEYCKFHESPTALATLARISADLGRRGTSVDSLKKLIRVSGAELTEPFAVPCARYEQLSPEGRESDWFVSAANEQFELTRSHSSCFLPVELERLKWLCSGPFGSPELFRRLALATARSKADINELAKFEKFQQFHCNPEYWSETGLQGVA